MRVDVRPHESPPRDRGWDVLLVGGAAGSGKSRLARLLSRSYAIPLLEVRDIVTALRALTTPQQHPTLHGLDTSPDVASLSPDDVVGIHLGVCAAVHDGLAAVIGDHLASRAPVVVEGDYLTPALAALPAYGGIAAERRVRSVFVEEPDVDQLVANLLIREPQLGEQRDRAMVSATFGRWLAAQQAPDGVHFLPARPWATLGARAMAVIDRG